MKRTTKNIQRAMMRVFLLLLTAFVAVSNLNAQEVTIDGLVYRLSESSAMVMHVEEGNVSIILHIPDKISYDGQEYIVNTIYPSAFSGNTNIEEIYAPACTYIGFEAFSGCSNLKQIEIPACKYIGEASFLSCKKLTVIELPECITVKAHAFHNCNNLQKIYLPMCTKVESRSFEACTSLRTISLDNCNEIGQIAFKDCTSLQKIYLPMVSLLSDDGSGYAYNFGGCVQLQSIDLPMCKIIGIRAFEGCTSLKYVSLGKAIDSIGDGAFNGCKNLLTFKVHSIITPTVGTDAFGSDNRIYANCELYIPAGREIAYNSADG